MHRRSILKTAGLAGVLATGLSPAVHAQAAIRWRLTSSVDHSRATSYGAAHLFAQRVRQLSGGRFDIVVHPAGERVPALGVVDAVQRGHVEAAHIAPPLLSSIDETFALGGAIPFGLNSRQMSAWTFEGRGLKLMREFYARYDILHFPCGNTGAQKLAWMRQPITNVRDLKGLKFRMDGLAGRVLERLGAIPHELPAVETCQALAKGRLDGAQWVGPHEDLKLGLGKVAPYCYYPGGWEGGLQLDLYINRHVFDRLSLEHQAIVEAASAYAHVQTQARHDVKNAAALQQLVAQGVRLHPFPNDVMTEAFVHAMSLYEELSARNPCWRKVYADYARFSADQNLCLRFSEARFNSFMQAQKL